MIWLESILTAALVVAADQFSKAFVLARWPPAGLTAPHSLVSIRCILNRHGTLAALAGAPALVALWAAMIMLAALILHYSLLGHEALVPIGVGAAIGGRQETSSIGCAAGRLWTSSQSGRGRYSI